MFDTVHMSVPFELNHDDEIVLYNDEVLSYIRYKPEWNRLLINCSIPKVIYGNNVAEINELDITKFWKIVENRIEELFQKTVNKNDWQVYRLDLCKNFKLENDRQLNLYIHQLAKIKLSRKDTFLRNNETVEYVNKSMKIHFYDKQKQLKHARIKDDSLLEQAKDILRFEIQLKKDGLRSYSHKCKAVDLLTQDFYKQVMNEQLELINTKLDQLDVSEDLLSSELFSLGLTISKIEKVFAFLTFIDEFGESFVRNTYGQNYYTRQTVLKEYNEKLKQKNSFKLAI
ncbi:phage/plasmid replication protein [Listeria monocytogenes]